MRGAFFTDADFSHQGLFNGKMSIGVNLEWTSLNVILRHVVLK